MAGLAEDDVEGLRDKEPLLGDTFPGEMEERPAEKAPKENRRADPLVLLREATIAKKKIKYLDEYLEFPGRRVHRNSKCAFRLSPGGPLMDIGSVWYMLHEISSATRSYTMDLTRKRGFTYIGVACRSGLMDYLVGNEETCFGIVTEMLDGSQRPKGDDEHAAKRIKGSLSDTEGSENSLERVKKELCYADVLARVRPVKDLDALVRCPGRQVPNCDLILRIAQEEIRSFNRPSQATAAVGRPALRPLAHELEGYLSKNPEAHPIIMVPCNKNAPVNLLNAHDFFQHGVYKRPDEEHLRFFESTRPEAVKVSRNIGGKLWTFEIRDNAAKFTKAQWKRTICVVCDGSDWQFKGWPFRATVDLFVTMVGFFIETPQVYVPVHVNSWQVHTLRMHAIHLEHRFAHVRDAFFDKLEGFMRSNRNAKFSNDATYDADFRVREKPKPIL